MVETVDRSTRRKRVSDEAMLDAARDAFVAEGFEGAGMDAIAVAAGTTKVTLYARYGSKHGLFRATFDREVDALQRRLIAAYDGGATSSPASRLHRYVTAYFDHARQQSQGFRLLFVDDGEPQTSQTTQTAEAMLTERIATLVSAERGVRRPTRDDLLLAALIVGATHHGAGAAVARGADVDRAQAATVRFLGSAIGSS